MAVSAVDRGDSVRRLAQYRPFDRGGQSLLAVLEDLVLAAAAINDGEFESYADCRTACATLWGLDIEIDEIRQVVDNLVDAKGAILTRAGFTLTEEMLAALEEKARESEAFEHEALLDWDRHVEQLHPDITDADREALRDDLNSWLQHVISRHGAEAALMLYPEDSKAHNLFSSIESEGTAFLPARGKQLDEVREEALLEFARRPSISQRRFLANRLNTAFYFTVLTLDPAAKNLVEGTTKDRRVYLDTNILLAILGAAEPREVASMHRLLQLTHGMGYEIAVTPWTVSELRYTINKDRRDVEKLRPNPAIAEMMVRLSGERGFGADFWRTFRDKGTSAQDYFDRVEHVEAEFDRLGIKIVNTGCRAIDAQTERVNDYAMVLNRVLKHARSDPVIDHDAKHRLLIERLRGDGHLRFSNARFWFLTQDTYLPRFAEKMPEPDEPGPDLPFCISPSSWVQLMRAFTPRTDDYEQTVVDLLASPFLGNRATPEPHVVRRVVGRMRDQEDRSPELALAVLQDSSLTACIEAAAPGLDEEEEVDRAFNTKARELQEAEAAATARAEAESLRAAKAVEQAEIDALRAESAEQRSETLTRDLADERIRREGVESDLNRKRTELEETADHFRSQIGEIEQNTAAQLAASDARIESLKAALAARRERLHHSLWAALLLAVAFASGVLVPVGFDVHEKAPLCGLLVGALTAATAAVELLLPKPLRAHVLTWIGIALAWAGLILAVVLTT